MNVSVLINGKRYTGIIVKRTGNDYVIKVGDKTLIYCKKSDIQKNKGWIKEVTVFILLMFILRVIYSGTF